jgi:hypothetical protein
MTDLNDIFVFNNHPNGVRWLDKDMNTNERQVVNSWWNEQIHQYGTEIDYYSSGYNLTEHDFVYGEDPTSKYKDPIRMIMCLNLNENAIVMQKFGLVAEDEVTGFMSIDSFHQAMSGDDKEPKSGDVFNLIEYGSRDRPGGREGKWFEITERLEQDVSQINPIIGHYIWLIKAKRFEYSYEPGLSGERVQDQVYDDAFSGVLTGGTQEVSDEKGYLDDIQDKSKQVFDYDKYEQSNTDVYGGYSPNEGDRPK